MTVRFKSLARALTVAAAVGLPSAVMAQPIAVTVNPLAVPAAIITNPLAVPAAILRAPFDIVFGPPSPYAYNPAPAAAAALDFRPDGFGTVPVGVLKQTGPRYVNPANADRRRVVVIRRGAPVPAFIPTQVSEDVSVPGLVPGARYDFFISPEGRTVFLDPASRRVTRILR